MWPTAALTRADAPAASGRGGRHTEPDRPGRAFSVSPKLGYDGTWDMPAPREGDTVGVVGAGVMGQGLAYALSRAGVRVELVDRDPAALARCDAAVREACRTQRLLGQGTGDPPDVLLARIHRSADYASLADASVVIESVTETWESKREAFAQLDAVCRPDAVIASNTSAMPITRLACFTGRPAQVLGAHFMNPPWAKKLVELVRGPLTADATVARFTTLLGVLDLEWVLVGDAPGFVTNRVLMLTINEAITLVHERVATAADVDRLFVGCFGHRMGPLATADLIGLDTILHTLRVLADALDARKFAPCPLLEWMVTAGLLGRKSGQGFYSYAGEP